MNHDSVAGTRTTNPTRRGDPDPGRRVGFAFVGSQVHLDVGGRDFYLDMLFYHLGLRCYVVLELKMGEFEPEHAGKLNFYLSAVDDLMLRPEDGPSIGLLLCKRKNQVVVEYALRDSHKPIGVASWQLTRALPDDLSSGLPSVEELEEELANPRVGAEPNKSD